MLARVWVGKWTPADVQTLRGLVIRNSDGREPAEGAARLFSTRAAVAECSAQYIEDAFSGEELWECPAADISVASQMPLPPEKAYAQPEDTGSLLSLLYVAAGAQVMLRKNWISPTGWSTELAALWTTPTRRRLAR